MATWWIWTTSLAVLMVVPLVVGARLMREQEDGRDRAAKQKRMEELRALEAKARKLSAVEGAQQWAHVVRKAAESDRSNRVRESCAYLLRLAAVLENVKHEEGVKFAEAVCWRAVKQALMLDGNLFKEGEKPVGANEELKAAYVRLANVEVRRGKHAEAESHYWSAYRAVEDMGSLDSVGATFMHMIRFHRKITKSKEKLDKVFAIWERKLEERKEVECSMTYLVEKSKMLNEKITFMAFDKEEGGRFHEALSLAEKEFLPIAKELDTITIVQHEGPELEAAYDLMANLYMQLKKFEESEKWIKMSIKKREEKVDDDEPGTDTEAENRKYLAYCYRFYANLLGTTDKFNEAADMFEKAATMMEEVGQDKEAAMMRISATSMFLRSAEKGKSTEVVTKGLEMAQDTLHHCEYAFGPVSTKLAEPLMLLSKAYWMLGKYSECEKPVLRALEICRNALGDSHSLTKTILTQLMELRRRLQNTKK